MAHHQGSVPECTEQKGEAREVAPIWPSTAIMGPEFEFQGPPEAVAVLPRARFMVEEGGGNGGGPGGVGGWKSGIP